MKHDPIRLHGIGCRCGLCRQPRFINARPIVLAAIGAALPVYGIAWVLWTILPN